jgi:signal transduction histidine kinase
MAQIIEDAERRVVHLAQETRAKINKPVCWPVALGHAPWIEEVWANYLSNAMTYGGAPPYIELGSDELEPVYDAAVLDTSGDEDDLVLPPGMVRFWIRDNGAGISPEYQSELFQPYHMRNAENGTNSVRGHGLGLSIVKRIVEKLNGHVGVESSGVPGEGSLFYFILPAAAPKFEDHG